MTHPSGTCYLLYMRANLEQVPKFRILFAREPGDDLALPEELGAERQPDGGWHLWQDNEPFSGIAIPAEAVGHLVEILTSHGVGQRAAPKEPPTETEPSPGYRIVAPGETIQAGDRWVYPDGKAYTTSSWLVGCPLGTGGPAEIVLQRPVAPKPTIEPDPGYRRVISGEISRDGDLWKYPDGHTIPGTPGLIHCDQTCGAILQRLDPSAVAPGHNPDKLTVEQVGIAEGWRLLTPAEVKEFRCKEVVPAEFWATGWNSGCSWFVTSDSTLRTKAEKLEVVS